MSPNPGEIDHDTRGWTHRMCQACWQQRHPGREPVRVRGDGFEPCCFCGRPTADGIYVRQNALEVHGAQT